MRMDDVVRTRLEPDISLAVVSFGNELKTGAMTTVEFLDAAVALGFEAVELCDRTIGDPGTLATALTDRGLALPSLALRNDFTGDRRSVAENIDHVRRWLDVAAGLSCRTARIWTGWQRADGVGRRQIRDAMDRVIRHAAAAGVAVAVETHGGLSNDPAFLSELCERYPRSGFGVCLDFGNLPAESRRAAIAALAPLTTHVHVKSHEFNAQGVETTIPLSWAISTVRDCGFDGQWVIEYEGPPPFEVGIDRTVLTLRRALGRIEVEAGRPW
jgi:sugar phosphate isomerase/epimerase